MKGQNGWPDVPARGSNVEHPAGVGYAPVSPRKAVTLKGSQPVSLSLSCPGKAPTSFIGFMGSYLIDNPV